ncbi:5-hydroxytryptamine receptor 3C-like, partial [Anoplopoma fimbria]|uniref:5-hydroxytryptamine receptor 3C-like n=1 Tax=Anoplopoma fimbria TaxID=229290 RepID=UPI0023EDEF77
TEKDKNLPSPYLVVESGGWVIVRNSMMVVSTCKMQIYKFPFDVQSCNLSFKSVIHSAKDIKLIQFEESSWNEDWSRKKMQTQSEWLFLDMTINNKTVDNFGFNQSILVYTITMKRRSALYIVNFLLPILFFLFLDLASFMISERGGEKLSFKVTVLLAVTVMQLILNDILPSSSDRIPLIAVYCIGSFSLMMLSLLETMLVTYLMDKDSASQDNEVDKDQRLSEECGDKYGKVSFHNNVAQKPGSSSQLTEESFDSDKISDELSEAVKTLTLLLHSRKEETKPGYWTR